MVEVSEFGAGPALGQNLDFDVTSTGDIRTEQDLDELEKDLAFQTIVNVQDLIGRAMTQNYQSKLKFHVRDALINDPRVVQITNLQLNFLPSQDEVEVVASIVTDDQEEHELVFPVR